MILELILTGVVAAAVAAGLTAFLSHKAHAERETSLQISNTKLEAELSHANERIDELKAQMVSEKAEMKARFDEDIKTLKEGFKETTDKFTAQLREESEKSLKDRQKEFAQSSSESLDQLLKPFKQNLEDIKKTMADSTKEMSEQNGKMTENVRQIIESTNATRRDAEKFTNTLKHDSKAQGDWGESVLEELLSSQGLVRGKHFETQSVLRDELGQVLPGEDGRKNNRPDVILHIDSKREVIIDSKASLTAFYNYVNAENEEQKTEALKEHLKSIHKHIDELAKKDYSSYIVAPKVSAGYTLMFVPISGAVWTALKVEPLLWHEAADKGVFIVDPSSLYATLKIIKNTWTIIAQQENQQKIVDAASEIVDRVGKLVKHMNSVGEAIAKAGKAYEDARDKIEPRGQSILISANKLLKLGAKNSATTPIPVIDLSEIPEIPEEQ